MWVRGLKQKHDRWGEKKNTVAPYVGAWIETKNSYQDNTFAESHPMWVRGLKRITIISHIRRLGRTLCGCVDWNLHQSRLSSHLRSHPMWVRGLKLQYFSLAELGEVSHPMWVRGLKPHLRAHRRRLRWSHPMWVRGLKLHSSATPLRRSGSHPMWVRVLKLNLRAHRRRLGCVAPYVGAWIETPSDSLPSVPSPCRTLCGCVDWNTIGALLSLTTACRTLCGCVNWNIII